MSICNKVDTRCSWMEEGKVIWKEELIERIFADIDRYWFKQGNTKHLNENPFESTS